MTPMEGALSQAFYVRLDNLETGETAEIRGEFSSEEWRMLRLFSARARRLVESGPVRTKARVSYRLQWEAGKGLSHHADAMLTPDELGAFLHRMRPFVLKGERTA